MSRYIDADMLKCEMQILVSNLEDMAESTGIQDLLRKRLNTLAEGVQRGIDMLNEQPTIEERKTGKWIEQEDYNGDTYYDCSVCGESWTTIEGTPWENGMNFCPHCGADMRGEG